MNSRGDRPSHVRPRPPSTGRPEPTPRRPKRSVPVTASSRGGNRNPGRRSRAGFPLRGRALAGAALAAAGLLVVVLVFGVLGVGRSVDPKSLSAPVLGQPASAATNSASVQLSVSVPTAALDHSDLQIRFYRTDDKGTATKIADVPIGSTATFTAAAIQLLPGTNSISASIAGPSSESARSNPVTITLDTSKPDVSIASPNPGTVTESSSVTLTGTTEPGLPVAVSNAANGATAQGQAGADGRWSIAISLKNGSNALTVSATDAAGNVGTATITVGRGTHGLAASISASATRISRKKLPTDLTLTIKVTDPGGRVVSGAEVNFSLTIPGIPAIARTGTTDGEGSLSFTISIPTGVSTGVGRAAALVTTSDLGSTSSQIAITIVE